MRVALLTTFAASKKVPLAEVMQGIHQAFLDTGLGEPVIRFNFADGLINSASIVARALKRFPELARFVSDASPAAGMPAARCLSNGPLAAAAGESPSFSLLYAIAAGVPRSFPFHNVVLHFHAPAFGDVIPTPLRSPELMAGVLLTDAWWVNGRTRSLSACVVLEADPTGKKLPSPPPAVATVFAACGKARRTVQAPLAGATPALTVPTPAVRTPIGSLIASADPNAAQAVHAIAQDYRSRMIEIVQRAGLPHDLPVGAPTVEAAQAEGKAGPKKPALERCFKPLGYTCRGGSGSFTLRRRTSTNLTVELHLDIGTWGHSVLGMLRIMGVGFRASLSLPVTERAVPHTQYPLGDAEQWQKIVENLAALVAELDRTFVPAVESAAGPSPDWYQPES